MLTLWSKLLRTGLMRIGLTILALAPTALIVEAAAAQGERPSTVSLDIEPQSLGTALNAFAQQSGLRVIFFSKISEGFRAPRVAGTLSPEAALGQLLANTSLSYEFVDERTVAIRSKDVATSSSSGTEESSIAPGGQSARLAQAVNAVDAQQSNAPSEPQRREGHSAPTVQEIIVTATKRAESIQDVPMSITAITAEDIERRRLVNAEDYLRGLPGVNQTEGYQGQAITIRGIETSLTLQNFFTGTTVATYFGETPTTNTAGTGGGTNVDIKLVDIERVEVLRGPQGTALGSSSMGGTVRTIPVAPKLDRFEAKVKGGYSNTARYGSDNTMMQGVANVPLIQGKLAVRAAAYQFNDSGFYRNNSRSSPTAALSALATANAVQGFLADQDDIGAYDVLGGRIAALFQPTDALKFTLSYLSQKNERDGTPVANSGTYEQQGFTLAARNIERGQGTGVTDMDIDIANATMEYGFSWADLVATYSRTNSGSVVAFAHSVALGNNNPWSQKANSDHREDVAEVRLSTKFQGAWNFLGGVYTERVKDASTYDNIWFGTPNAFPANPDTIGFRIDRRNVTQKAVFAEASWDIVPKLTLTGGIRAYDYERDLYIDLIGQAYNGIPRANIHDINFRTAGATGQSYKGNLSYKPVENTLLYAGYTQGFRLGQSQLGLTPGTCDVNNDGIVDGTGFTIVSTQLVNSDQIDNYELGGKFELLDRRVTIAADVFHMDWTDMPFNVSVPTCGNVTYITNVGKAVSEGVELHAEFQVTEPLRVELSGSWIDARLDKDATIPAGIARKGNDLPGAPKLNATLSLEYEFAVGAHQSYVRLDSVRVGSFYGDLLNTPTARVAPYTKYDVSAGVDIGHLNVALFVNNLTNQDAETFRNSTNASARTLEFGGYRLRPRTVGMQLGYDF